MFFLLGFNFLKEGFVCSPVLCANPRGSLTGRKAIGTENTVSIPFHYLPQCLGKTESSGPVLLAPGELTGSCCWAGASMAGAGSWRWPREVRRGAGLVEGVRVGPDHHHHFLERVGASSELSPVDSVLVAAPVMAPAVPDPIEVGVGTGVIPPASLLVVGTVSCRRQGRRSQGGGSFTRIPRLFGDFSRAISGGGGGHLEQEFLRGGLHFRFALSSEARPCDQ